MANHMQTSTTQSCPDHDYRAFEAQREAYAEASRYVTALFTTNTTDLFPLFLANLPPEQQQHHTCNTCRHFVNRYGGLVSIAADGTQTPVMWTAAPGMYAQAFAALRERVSKARVTGIFLTRFSGLGTPQTGFWRHMSAKAPTCCLWAGKLTAGQRMAELREEYGMLQRALSELSLSIAEQALAVVQSGALNRSEKVVGPASWLVEVIKARDSVSDRRARENVTWRAVASAPPGFCHIRNTMIGTLLGDLQAGKPFAEVKRAFDAKMNPLQYQRPTAALSDRQIAIAEKLAEELSLRPALRRRYARLEEVRAMWRHEERADANDGSLFGHLSTKRQSNLISITDAQKITWEKFAAEVLPGAEAIDYLVGPRIQGIAIVTAADYAARPIIQWDSPEARNPFSWYVYNNTSAPSAWNLVPGWTRVNAICRLPSTWQPGYEHHGAGVVLILAGCRDMRKAGLGLFPEFLKNELRDVRRVIEAYSNKGFIEGTEEAAACGLDLRQGHAWDARVRVTSKRLVTEYILDRWA